ncbi:sulfatase [Paraglaciecola aquimarina]|uniref:Sulfatase n=1 Tax=Paraglaciecola algarum TaxID=3050085 RepID=A0ABS9DAF6_9ALTE|nr:sulfatase [Paraglaciecola sp. G1-23]MCF2949873.1 sulfatase [Paraglaciecola sp. G1-23]
MFNKFPNSFLLFILITSSFTTLAQATKPNFVWLVSEDNSKHYLKLYDPQGATMPNVESLAKEGLIFNHAFSNAAVCSTARSTLALGSYTPRLAMNNHRPYKQAELPEGLKPISLFLKEAGYYTSNDVKTDFNFEDQDGIWNKSARKASWRDRKDGQPFFHMQTFTITHESQLQFPANDLENVPSQHDYKNITLPPIYPNTDLFKYTYARTLDNHLKADKQIGEVLNKLKQDKLMDDTFIFYFGDHGGVLPASKGYLFERGLHVPLIVYVPKNFRHLVHEDIRELKHTYVDGFVSFIDFAPTLMKLAGLEASDKQDGSAFLGKDIGLNELKARDTTLGYADRFDEKYDLVRSLRKGKYKYIRHYQPFNPDVLYNAYRFKNHALKQWRDLYQAGQLNPVQTTFFETKPVEALYDVENDPYETHNLATDKQYRAKLIQLRQELTSRLKAMPDLGFYPESWQVQHALAAPEKFASSNKTEIAKLIDIADLQLSEFSEVKDQLSKALTSDNQWHRYWALINLSWFGNDIKEYHPIIEKFLHFIGLNRFSQEIKTIAPIVQDIVENDPNLLNRARAVEYLAITGQLNANQSIEQLVTQSNNDIEALEMMNIATQLHDTKGTKFNFSVKPEWHADFKGDLTDKQQKNLHYWLTNRMNYLKQ